MRPEQGGSGAPAGGVDGQAAEQRSFANSTATANGRSGDDSSGTPSASTSGGGVSVAAAVGINITETLSRATIVPGLVVVAGGLFTLRTSAHTDAKAGADGSAVQPGGSGVAIGAGVAINLAKVVNEAFLPGGATVTARGAAVEALMTTAGATHDFGAEAKAGAGGGSVSVAGSLGLNIVNVRTEGLLKTGSVLNAGTGNVSIKAESLATSLTTALPAELGNVPGAESVGIGAAVALAIIDDVATAAIEDGATLSGGADVTIGAKGGHLATTKAKTGAAGGDVAIVPSVGITLSNVTTTAYVGTGVALSITGTLAAKAEQASSAHTTAEGSATASSAAIGVALALTIADHKVTSFLERNVTAGGGVGFEALGSSASSAVAKASAAGAPEEGGMGAPAGGVDGQAAEQRTFANSTATSNGGSGAGDSAAAPNANTSSGGVSVAAAIGINIAETLSRATIVPGVVVVAGGVFTLRTSAHTDAKAGADGSAVQPGGSGVAIGAGVAINLAKVVNEAFLPGGATVTSTGAAVEALMTGAGSTHDFGAEAKAGAGGGSVSVAGSLGLNIVNLRTEGLLKTGSVLNARTGDVSIRADSLATSLTTALPAELGNVPGAESVGIGAAVALAIIDDVATAAIEDGATLTNSDDVTIAAKGGHLATTKAKTGAAGGDVAVVPSVGITLSNVTTTAYVGTGVALSITGTLSAKAEQASSAHTTAEGSATAASAAIGVALALTIADHKTDAFLERNVTAGGAISFQALGASASSATAKASAAGAPADGEAGAPAGGVDGQAAGQRTFANSTATANGGTGSSDSSAAPSAETSSGGVSVAAAVAITISETKSRAWVVTGLTIVAGGAFTLRTSAHTDAATTADGSAVQPGGSSGVAVGAGVAITFAKVVNHAWIPGPVNVTATGVVVEALMTGAGSVHEFGAQGSSGAGGGDVSVAGSLGLNIVNVQTTASLQPGAIVNARTGDVSIKAESHSTSIVKALPATLGNAPAAESVGIGASVAISLVDDTTLAAIESGATLTGGNNVTVNAVSSHALTTEAKTGAAGGDVAVVPAVAIAISNIISRAWLGTGTALNVTGSVTVKAEQTASSLTKAEGSATASSAAIGVAFSLTLAHHTVEAWTERNVTAGGSVGFLAFGSSATSAETKASANGAPGEGDSGQPSGNVDSQVAQQRSFGNGVATSNGNAGGGMSSGSSASASSSNNGSSNSVSVAASISVNIAITISRAWIVDGRVIVAGGAVSVKTSAHTDAKAVADSSAVGSGSSGGAGIAASVAINYVELTNFATTGVTTITANGLHVDALMTGGSSSKHDFGAQTTSGAGKANIGVAGSIAISIVIDKTYAIVPTGAVIAAGTGDVSVLAENRRAEIYKADAVVSGAGEVGVGASVVVVVDTPNETWAEVRDGATVTGGRDFAVEATATQTMTTTVKAGSAGSVSVSPGVAVIITINDTKARIGTGVAISATGAVTVRASLNESLTTTGDADAAGDSVGVGAMVGVHVVLVTTVAQVFRNVTGASIAVTSTSEIASSIEVKASSKGQDSSGQSADSQANSEVSGNPNSNGKTPTLPSANDQATSGNSTASSESGSSSGGVSVAAAVAVNWLDIDNTASTAPSLVLRGTTGAVDVIATAQTDATSKATGLSANIQGDVNVGAAVGFNYVVVDSNGSIGANSNVTGVGVSVGALTPAGQRNDIVAWGLAAAGGKSDASVAASIGINFVDYESIALDRLRLDDHLDRVPEGQRLGADGPAEHHRGRRRRRSAASPSARRSRSTSSRSTRTRSSTST